MYQVKVTPNYYGGTLGSPSENYATVAEVEDDPNARYGDDIMSWDTREEAEAWIAKMSEGTYCLAHGEAGRPTYTIVEDLDDGEPDCVSASGVYGAPDWEEASPDDIPSKILTALSWADVTDNQDDDMTRPYQVWQADAGKYRIVYCPRHIALQRCADDLTSLDWDNEAYYRRTDR